MKKYLETIIASSLFAGVTAQQAQEMLSCLNARTTVAAKGDYVLRAGEEARALGLVLEGSILIVQEDFWGRRNLMARIMTGHIFAESFACMPGAALNVSAIADEPSRVIWLNVGHILAKCPQRCVYHDKVVGNLIVELAGKNLHFSQKLAHMGKRTTREKLLSYLSEQAQQQGGAEFSVPFSRQQLADYLCVERSAMSTELGKLRSEGYLSFEKNRFILHIMDGE